MYCAETFRMRASKKSRFSCDGMSDWCSNTWLGNLPPPLLYELPRYLYLSIPTELRPSPVNEGLMAAVVNAELKLAAVVLVVSVWEHWLAKGLLFKSLPWTLQRRSVLAAQHHRHDDSHCDICPFS